MTGEQNEGAVEVHLGITPEEPPEVRQYDAVTGTWSEWVEVNEFIGCIEDRTARQKMTRAINEAVYAERVRWKRLRRLLRDKPDMTMARLKSMTVMPESKRMAALAECLIERGVLDENRRTGALRFREPETGRNGKGVMNGVLVRILEDLPLITTPDSILVLWEGDEVLLPSNYARTLIGKGVAVEVSHEPSGDGVTHERSEAI